MSEPLSDKRLERIRAIPPRRRGDSELSIMLDAKEVAKEFGKNLRNSLKEFDND